ncbi:MAG: hypothetical protein QOH23_109 [Gaiellaceae bacterium]|jgi:hypothetical protein|nr:hypothetical protein [Gaiellaceae bacterium]
MTELERALLQLGRELDWPAEPDLLSRVRARTERKRFARPLVVAVALAVVAFAIAFAVPQARSAILRFFHIGAVTIERVETLPAVQERPLAAGLGPALTLKEAEAQSGVPLVLEGPRSQHFYAQPGLLATLIRYHGKPILLAELQGEQLGITKKLAGSSTHVEPAAIGSSGLWLTGGRHLLIWETGAESTGRIRPRLAGNVLIWTEGDRTFRLEGDLDERRMLKLGRQITH